MLRRFAVAAALAAVGTLAGAAGSTSALYTDSTGVGGNGLSTATLQPPTGLSATAGCDLLTPKITLSWTATTSTFADGYDVYRSGTSGGPYSLIAHVSGRTTTSYVNNSGLLLNSRYYYVLKSTAYGWTSGNSNQANAKTPIVCL